ncbi:MAG: OmpA family protein [Flavobacteriales bacterium]|jgi:outer membrane protein OmpA-like peptidoglycan-associated protein|nr:OmpA family protein [Flavobacteriales bacterium]
MQLKHIVFILSFCSTFLFFGQEKVTNKEIKKAQKAYYFGDYDKAVSAFKSILDKDENHYIANYELGRIYLEHYNFYDSAEYHLKKTIDYPQKDTIFETYLDYANCLHASNQFEAAVKNYQLFIDKGLAKNSFAELLKGNVENKIKQCEYAIAAELKKEKEASILVKNLGSKTNTSKSEYASVYLEKSKKLLYTTRYKDAAKEKRYKDNRYFENEYILDLSQDSTGKKLSANELKEIRKKHNAFVSKSFTEDTIVLYRENKLWFSTYENGAFSKPELFDESINFSNYQPHGVFSKDGKTFIFSARDKKGKGGLDLYQSVLGKDNKWSEAVLLDDVINTEDNEDSPFLSEDGKTLYFASKGHKGYGAYDLFKSTMTDGKWSAPINLGMPINSASDDIYLSINKEENKGYLSSNRLGGKGAMDLYYLQDFTKPTFDCEPYQNKPFTVSFDLSNSIDKRGVALDYKWNFEDGNIKYGEKVSHAFKYPGTYHISLDIIDKLSGKLEQKEEIEEIKIENVNFVGVKLDSVGEVNKLQKLDASVTSLKNKEIRNIFWNIDAVDQEKDTTILDYTFDKLGWHEVKIQVVAFDDSLALFETYCQVDSIRIVSAEDYQKAVEAAGNQLDSLNNGLLSDAAIDSMLTAGLGFQLDPVYFNFDKSYLTLQARKILDQNIEKLKAHRYAYIIVKGHTDAMGSDSYNEKLSARRSASVMKYLLKHGVEKNRVVEVQNFGETTPAAPNTTASGADNPKGRKLNRRVEFQLLKSKK